MHNKTPFKAHIAAYLCALLIPASALSQNLVHNPSFEQHTTCTYAEPFDTSFNHIIPYWGSGNYSGTVDYYNTCYSHPNFPYYYSIPRNRNGYQYARSGTAYVGIVTGSTFPQINHEGREYVQSKLKKKLKKGAKYCAGFYTSLADRDSAFVASSTSDAANGNWGILLTKERPFNPTDASKHPAPLHSYLLEGTPQINVGPPLKDTSNWVLVSGELVAEGDEQWLTIGNFVPLGQSWFEIIKPGTFGIEAYYYIDDVFVVPMDDGGLLPPDTMVCLSNLPLKLRAYDGFSNYQWEDGHSGQERSFSMPGTYVLTADFEGGCPIRDSIRIGFFPPPSISLDPIQVCLSALPMPYTAPKVDGASSYIWSDGSTGRTVLLQKPGLLTLSVSGECGTVQGDLWAIEEPPLMVDIGDEVDLCVDGAVQAQVLRSRFPLPNYQWSTGETTEQIWADKPGIYRLSAIGACGEVSDELLALGCEPKVYLPNVFDPDAHTAANRVFLPFASNAELLRMEIYDRWGGLVYTESPVSRGWDGSWRGRRCQPGVYVCRLVYRRTDTGEVSWVSSDVSLL